jgi:CheY-like chemotaxis protein
MKRQTDQLCRIVDGLLDLMRITHNKIELKKEIIELNELMSISAKDHKPLFDNKGIELRLAENKDEIYVEADPVRIKQITGNLLHNALKFTESGGSVILSVYEEKGQAIICVKDSGIGISADDISNLFEPFAQIDKQIDRRLGGLGLGLAIVKEIAQLHGGDASAFSEGEGNGSSFYITLPLASDGKVQSPEITREEGRAKKLSVLLIEDNKDYCDMMCAMLKNLGYDTECVHHGLEGIAKAKECLPDAIICDIGLPGMSGYEVARTIRGVKNMNSVLLIALTGYTGSSDIEAAKEARFDHHIAKPVNMEYLRCILNKA